MQNIHDATAHSPFRHMRYNYGSRAVVPGTHKAIDCGLVLLDLLMPAHWVDDRMRDNIEHSIIVSGERRELVHHKNVNDSIVLHRIPVPKSLIDGLLHYGAICPIASPWSDITTYSLTGVGFGICHVLLKTHDEMHIGQSLELRPGIYRHMKGNPYNVLWTSEDTETHDITVEYQPLAGPHPLRHSHRPLSMFTQVVYRPELGHYLGPRWQLEKEFPEPRILKAEDVASVLAKA